MRNMLGKIVCALLVIFTLCFVLYKYMNRSSDPSSKIVTSDDIAKLKSQINIPNDAKNASWQFSYRSGGGIVPSPGSARITGSFTVSQETMRHLRESGVWSREALPQEVFGEMPVFAVNKAAIMRNISDSPRDKMIYGTTWMEIDVYIDEANYIVYITASKS